MVKMVLLVVIIQLFIGLNLGSAVRNDFCNSDLQLISIFNLGEDTFFQDAHTNFWKMNETEITGNEFGTFPLAQKTVRIDIKIGTFLAKYFDIGQTLFGFTTIDEIETIDEAYLHCTNNTSPGNEAEVRECLDVNIDPNVHYTCFLGYKGPTLDNQTLEVFKYNYSELQEFQSESLKKRIEFYCENITQNVVKLFPEATGNHLIAGLQYYDRDPEHNYTLLKRQVLINPDMNDPLLNMYTYYELYEEVGDKSTWYKHKYASNKINASTFLYVFRYNSNLGIFGCPQGCTINSNLTKLYITEDKAPEPSELTIANLIRCPDYKIWHPNEFCSQSGFQSTFNLGKDIVFQNRGKLWRYISLGADNMGNPSLENKITSIRFDYDMLWFLEKYFDLSLPIHGFTFKHDVQDMCDRNDNQHIFESCERHFRTFKSLPYYRACIFGTQMHFEQDNIQYRKNVQAFYYTPSGLQPFVNSSIEKETKRFCQRIGESLSSDELTGILGDHISTPDSSTEIYAFFRDTEKKMKYYFASMPSDFDLLSDLTWSPLTVANNPNQVDSINFLWYYNKIVGHTARNVSEGPSFHEMTQLSSRFDPGNRTFSLISQSIYTLYNCPFSQSYSLAYEEEDLPCKDFDNVYSVFRIVEKIYHQKGRRFYRAIMTKNRRRLLFDKYLTDLMNDNFDTRYKVMALSYPVEDGLEHRVLVVGRTKYVTKSLGEKIFRAFTTTGSPLAPLEAVNNPEFLEVEVGVTFGLIDETLKNSQIKGMEYLETPYAYVKGGTVKEDIFAQMILVLNQTHIYSTDERQRFLFPFENEFRSVLTKEHHAWRRLKFYQDTSPFTDIFGMFEYKGKLYVTAWPPKNETRDKPRVVKIFEYRPTINRTYWLSQFEKHEIWDFNEYFNCSQSEAGSESSSPQKSENVIYLVIILFVMLILMAAVVGAIAIDTNKSEANANSKEMAESSKQSKVSSKSKTDKKVGPQNSQKKTSDKRGSSESKQMNKSSSLATQSVRSDLGA